MCVCVCVCVVCVCVSASVCVCMCVCGGEKMRCVCTNGHSGALHTTVLYC